jgi:DNA polymerase-3 subunit epsilon
MPELVDTLRLSRDGRFSAKVTEYTAIDFETTGLHPGHIVEIAAVRIRADGTVLGELSTLVNPGPGIDPGPTHIHRITRRQLDEAPSLGDVLGEFLDLCRESVVVAHNLPFEKRFLAEELVRLGVRMPALPGVCTLSSSRIALRLPNYRLATVASAIGIDEYAAHTALADAQVCARLVSSLVMTHGLTFERQPRHPELPSFGRGRQLLPRAGALPVESGWMAQLVDRIPTAAVAVAEAPVEDAYLEMLTDALADQHISADESRALVGLAAEAGLSEEDVLRIHKGFVSAMRTVAEADGIITTDEERDLRQVAAALGVPELLEDLRPAKAISLSSTRRVLVLGRTAEADELRAKVLDAGIQLAKKLTASVSHVVVGDDIPATEPRLARAREFGAEVLEFSAAQEVLGLAFDAPASPSVEETTVVIPMTLPAPPPLPKVVLTPSSQFRVAPVEEAPAKSGALWVGRGLMGLGLLLMLITVLALFGGSGFGAGLVLAVLGVGALVGGWYLTSRDPAEKPVHQDF